MDLSDIIDELLPLLLVPGAWRYWAEHSLEREAQIALAILARLALEMSPHDIYSYLLDAAAPPPRGPAERRRRRRRTTDQPGAS